MSQVKANKIQAGISLTPANNFVLDASADDGTVVLKRADGTEVLSVDASGNLIGKGVDPTDGTVGRLLQLGDFGLGDDAIDTYDLDSITDTGYYQYGGTAINAPAGSSGAVIHIARSARPIQIAVSYLLTRMYLRTYLPTGWTDWQEVYTQHSILGTVSESSGTPTGAIIEAGSNANGNYTKFADGTLICTGIGTFPATAVGATGSLTRDWPAPFIELPIITWGIFEASVEAGSVAGAGEIYRNGAFVKGSSATVFKLSVYTYTEDIAYSNTIDYIGIGRWF